MMFAMSIEFPIVNQSHTTTEAAENIDLNFGNAKWVEGYCTFPNLAINSPSKLKSIQISYSGEDHSSATNINFTLVDGITKSGDASNTLATFGVSDYSKAENFLRNIKYYCSTKQTINIMLSESEIPNGVNYFPGTGHFYKHVDKGGAITWLDAYKEALNTNIGGWRGYLAVITSEEENNFIYNYSGGSTGKNVGWIGATRLKLNNTGESTASISTGNDYNFWYWACGPELFFKPNNSNWSINTNATEEESKNGTYNEGANVNNSVFYPKKKLSESQNSYTNPTHYTYSCWARDEPNDSGTEECGMTLENSKNWNDFTYRGSASDSRCRVYGYIIEFGDRLYGNSQNLVGSSIFTQEISAYDVTPLTVEKPQMTSNNLIYNNDSFAANDVKLNYTIQNTPGFPGEKVSEIDKNGYTIIINGKSLAVKSDSDFTSDGISNINITENGIEFTIFAEGTHTVKIQAKDKQGNVTTEQTDNTVKIDKTKPDPPTIDVNDWYNTPTPTISVTGEPNCNIQIRSKDEETIIETQIRENGNVVLTMPKLPDGNHQLVGVVVDKVAHASDKTQFTLNIDTVNPYAEIKVKENQTINFFEGLNFIFFKQPVEINIICRDSFSGVEEARYFESDSDIDQYDLENKINWNSTNVIYNQENYFVATVTVDWASWDENKFNETLFIYVRIKDKAGNCTCVRSDGSIVYKLSTQATEELSFFKDPVSAAVNLNGNTINKIQRRDGEILSLETDYTATSNMITFNSDYLNTLDFGEHLFDIFYNPAGIIPQSEEDLQKTSLKINVLKQELVVEKTARDIFYNTKTPIIRGKAFYTSTIKITEGSKLLGQCDVLDDGTWQITVGELKDGMHNILISEYNNKHNYIGKIGSDNETSQPATEEHDNNEENDGQKLKSLTSDPPNPDIHLLEGSTLNEDQPELQPEFKDLENLQNDVVVDWRTGFLCIDTIPPSGEMKLKEKNLNKIFNVLTFGLLFKDSAQMEISCKDFGSGLEKVQYFESNRVYKKDEITKIDWSTTSVIEGRVDSNSAKAAINSTEKFDEREVATSINFNFDIGSINIEQLNKSLFLYVRIIDNSGNVTYMSSDGMMMETDGVVTVLTKILEDQELYKNYEKNLKKRLKRDSLDIVIYRIDAFDKDGKKIPTDTKLRNGLRVPLPLNFETKNTLLLTSCLKKEDLICEILEEGLLDDDAHEENNTRVLKIQEYYVGSYIAFLDI
jgi:hypothetical protein